MRRGCVGGRAKQQSTQPGFLHAWPHEAILCLMESPSPYGLPPGRKRSAGIGRLGHKLRLLVSDAERQDGEGQNFSGYDAGYELHFASASMASMSGACQFTSSLSQRLGSRRS
jgi:hypothetical protein